MTTRDILVRARNLINQSNAWTQGCFARDVNTEMCEPNDQDAVRWCAIGAIMCATEDTAAQSLALDALGHHGIRFASNNLAKAIVDWNDYEERDHEEVLAAFDRAIAKLEKAKTP